MFENAKINDIRQGFKFEDRKGKVYMKLPNHSSCCGKECNAVDIETGTMVYLTPTAEVKLLGRNYYCDQYVFWDR